MPANSALWEHATADTIASIANYTKDLGPESEVGHQIDEFVSGCKRMARQETASQAGGEVGGQETLSRLRKLYAALKVSLTPSLNGSETVCTCPVELLESQLRCLIMNTEKSVAADPLWVKKITDSVRAESISACRDAQIKRNGAVTTIVEDALTLRLKEQASLSRQEKEQIAWLPIEVEKYIN
jgi:hypothetical protein